MGLELTERQEPHPATGTYSANPLPIDVSNLGGPAGQRGKGEEMIHLRSIVVILALAVSLMASATPVKAQEGTPAATPTADRIIPLPEECMVEPRSTESLMALATPTNDATPFTTPAVPEIPFGAFAGTPADAETAAEYTAFIRHFWACNNTQDMSRILALVTDEEILRSFPPEAILSFTEPAQGTPVPLAQDELSVIFAILGIEDLGNERVGAYVVVDTYFDPLPVEVNYMIATETAEGWQLDAFVCFNEAGGYCA
jgi:hypothetical protein